MKKLIIFSITLHFIFTNILFAQQSTYLKPERIFDGEKVLEKYGVLLKANKIEKVALHTDIEKNLASDTKIIELKNCTLLPGLIEGHTHLFLHPYNETSWNDQVLKESRSYRTARAVKHAERTLKAGFTTARDLGTEGAEFDDVGLKRAINENVILGPRLLIATKALVATGSYAPKGFASDIDVPQGAEEADGHDDLIKKVRNQIGRGADVIKIYADYRWGLKGEAAPTFTLEEIKLIVSTAKSSGRPTVAHASTAEGMKRAILGGVETIEHGDNGTPEIWKLMAEKNVFLCPTLAAGDAILQYGGWKKGIDMEPERIKQKKETFKEILNSGVRICMGGDVGVFPHGDNAREIEMLVEYGMKPIEALKSATSTNADAFHIEKQVGRIKDGLLADILVVEGDPSKDIKSIRNIKLVIKDGQAIE
ncbi:amidohydrolase family protein [Emticicia sp. BO119]|uniref:metal-dependent hydrolase family protein n=1 Tax=Emticicia sp. BO119 TaxID=2757768 RepID=UPI0015F06368|nr:amidohydrolase family protein [Emticicia sp. BO119]MBA4853478.1 amidohydrolase family protein [Emticicia sp. BO119]